MKHHADSRPKRGQSTVEFALIAPLMVMGVGVLMATIGVCIDAAHLHDVARNAVRAAITADEPEASVDILARRFKVQANTIVDSRTGLVTVVVRRRHRLGIPIVGRLIPPLALGASATMLREPPIVLA